MAVDMACLHGVLIRQTMMHSSILKATHRHDAWQGFPISAPSDIWHFVRLETGSSQQTKVDHL
jgi:hypothetical protein